MRLADLLEGTPVTRVTGPTDVEITDIVTDSRKASSGSLFVGLKGEHFDGYDFAVSAVAGGARAVAGEREPAGNHPEISWIQVPDAVEAVWRLSHRLYGDPTDKLMLIGVTGTNGKTTTTHLISTILNFAGTKCTSIGTLGAKFGDATLDMGFTTPMADDLVRAFRRCVDEDYQAVAMEVSSHALALRRVDGSRFDAAVYTNLTPEHLDFHKTMDEYFVAKARLFNDLSIAGGKEFVGVINMDDPYGARMATEVRGRLVTYGRNEGDVRVEHLKVSAQNIEFTLIAGTESLRIQMPLGGHFNVSNGLAAAATAWSIGVPLDTIALALANATAAPGRFENVPTGHEFGVIVDYAHSPDALEKLLESCRDLHPDRLTLVFGCGGDRDRTKRPKMGAIASRLADRILVTSDNPRTEEPNSIIEAIVAGIDPNGRAAVEVEPDRRRAIQIALDSARSGELIVIAGKGHEDYQIVGTEKYHFDDREVVREALT